MNGLAEQMAGLEWCAEWYPSGSAVLKRTVLPRPNSGEAHLSFHGPTGDGGYENDNRDGFLMARAVRDWWNGVSERPGWLDDMERVSETRLVGTDGSRVEACGPFYDRNPPHLFWDTRTDLAAEKMRSDLVERLFMLEAAR